MSAVPAYNDLDGRLQQVFSLPKKEQASPAIKMDLFSRLLYQPVIDRNLYLADIAKTQGITLEQAQEDFVVFAEKVEDDRKKAPVRLGRTLKRQDKPQDEPQEHDLPLTTRLSDIEPQAVNWLWPDFIPIGSATLISGDPGSAKTWLALDLAARLSRGTKWIDGVPIEAAANTVFLGVEDDTANTIRPRFDSLGGDPSRIFVYTPEQKTNLNLSDPTGVDQLRDEVERIGSVRLVIVDPIIDFSGTIDPNKGEEVRALLTPLVRMASQLGFALVIVGHLNKSQTQSAIYRAGGSTSGWLGKCRAAFLVFRDLDDRALRHVAALKANLATQDLPQIEFRIDKGQLFSRISVEAVDIDEQLAPKIGRRPREKEAVAEWLTALFDGRDEIPAQEIEEEAKAKGFSHETLKRAKAAGGYISKRTKLPGGKDGWAWQRITISEGGK